MIESPLWSPSTGQMKATRLEAFRRQLEYDHGMQLPDYAALHRWSVANSELFWSELWSFAGVLGERGEGPVLQNPHAMPGARWFPEARLNYAENLLRRTDAGEAVVFRGEPVGERTGRAGGGNGLELRLSWAELNRAVASVASGLRQCGVQRGDHVAAFVPNIPQAVIAMLATTSLGAVWSSCSPDFGVNGVLDRFGQLEPVVLFSASGYTYAGKRHDSLAVANELVAAMPEVRQLVVIDYPGEASASAPDRGASISGHDNSSGQGRVGATLDRLTGRAAECAVSFERWLAIDAGPVPRFEAVPFDHPLYVMFSSGTTGKPKCIVHGTGGTLLQHLKEHQLHTDVRADDRLFFFTTCGWMMWNWLVSGLASGATLLLYDGSPFHPDGNTVFDFAAAERMTHLGISAKFIDAAHKAGISPIHSHDLSALRVIMSTGSPLVPESYDFVYREVKSDVCLSSISGGTDILSCFALGNPALPVWRGELQCLGLGMDVQVLGDDGQPVPSGEKGELACMQPFPCMPVGFLNDPDGQRYRAAYFARFPGTWCHGDYVSMSAHGGLVIYGRSDAVLNPGGVRIGTAEIYRQVERIDEVLESLVIAQQWAGDVRVVLFVRLRDDLVLDDPLVERICAQIRREATPRHVPARVLQVADIPRTRSGKIVELAVRKVVHGEPVDNLEALANPEALKLFADRAELQA